MKKRDLITFLSGLAVIAVLAIVFMRGDQLQHLISIIERGTPFFLFLAFASQLFKYVFQGFSFTWCFKAVGANMPISQNIALVFQTFFIDTVIPSFNISGTSTVVEVASQHDIEAGRATGAALLRQVSISASFVIVMVVGFGVLLCIGKLETGWIILGIGAVVAVGALVAAMVLAAVRPQWVLTIAAPFERVLDKLFAKLKRHSIDASVQNFVDTYSSAAKGMVGHANDIAIELLLSVLAYVAELFCFYFSCLAFGVDNFVAALCVYVVATLAAMASPVPQGIGVVEGASLVAFTLFSIEQASGMAIIMVYRLFVFWLPFLVGAALMRKVKSKKQDQSK